eukprot:CAMPEP_0179876528 /NCGR_PEP_ID=MMETSP0982-20121206/24256_1 /TAXON_ID=483367 /ORGANISM="non described non described, Strain CCMP 2436" /LENGTH=34 /DNA_ID= /DNA_START= /DNA_END= /DNA_ORIENTATION=
MTRPFCGPPLVFPVSAAAALGAPVSEAVARQWTL